MDILEGLSTNLLAPAPPATTVDIGVADTVHQPQPVTPWPVVRDLFLRRLAEGASVEDIIRPHFQHLCTASVSDMAMVNILYEQGALKRIQCDEIMNVKGNLKRWTKLYGMMIKLNMGRELLVAWKRSGNEHIARHLHFVYTHPQPRDDASRLQRTRAHSSRISLAGGFTFLRNRHQTRTTKIVLNAYPWVTLAGIIIVTVVLAVKHEKPHLPKTSMDQPVTDSTMVLYGNDQEKVNDSGGTAVPPTKPAATTSSSLSFPTTPSSLSSIIIPDDQTQETEPLDNWGVETDVTSTSVTSDEPALDLNESTWNSIEQTQMTFSPFDTTSPQQGYQDTCDLVVMCLTDFYQLEKRPYDQVTAKLTREELARSESQENYFQERPAIVGRGVKTLKIEGPMSPAWFNFLLMNLIDLESLEIDTVQLCNGSSKDVVRLSTASSSRTPSSLLSLVANQNLNGVKTIFVQNCRVCPMTSWILGLDMIGLTHVLIFDCVHTNRIFPTVKLFFYTHLNSISTILLCRNSFCSNCQYTDIYSKRLESFEISDTCG